MVIPRIFVGTMACGEAEFEACCAAIAQQRDVRITHHVIKDKAEYEAHNALWAAWAVAKPNHDLFVKVDADTILNRETALAEIAGLFQTPNVTGAQILLHDYFTDRPISGLNAFSRDVVFKPARTRLFADHADTGHKVVLKGDPVAHLAPIGWHGRNPHPKQAFHYGFHRKLKGQMDTLRRVAELWGNHHDSAREWALAGAASARWWHRADYGAGAFSRAFSRMADDRLRAETVVRYATELTPKRDVAA